MYVCGVTVYDDIHMGHARSMIVFDMVAKYLRYRGYDVTHVTNFTDVDDKIITRAAEKGMEPLELSKMYIDRYFQEIEKLGIGRADIYPKASESMGDIIEMCKEIIDNGYGYVTSDGSVYFSVEKAKSFGCLTNKTLKDMMSTGRIANDEQKRNPLDFAIWKAAKPGEISWDSPWGKGRPGWHIECSAMIRHHLGKRIDIHGGGNDLIFPHHENEMAQAKAHDGHKLAHFWMHNGFININNEKMSKSLGNVILMKDVVKEYGGIPFRLMLLASHYRAPASFSADTIKEAQTKYSQIETAMKKVAILLERKDVDIDSLKPSDENKFLDALCDDLNTPNALSVLYEEVKTLNSLWRVKEINYEALSDSFAKVRSYCDVLGLTLHIPHLNLEDKKLYEEYDIAKKNKDFAKSDEIRQTLLSKNLF